MATRNKTFHEFVDDLYVSIFDDLLCVLYLFLFKHCSSRFILFFSFFGGIESEKTVNYNISEAGFSSPPLQPPPFV